MERLMTINDIIMIMVVHLIVALIKKTLYKTRQYFPKPLKSFGGNINVKIHMSDYARIADLKNLAGVDKSKLAARSDLAHLKAEIDKLDVEKLKTTPVD